MSKCKILFFLAIFFSFYGIQSGFASVPQLSTDFLVEGTWGHDGGYTVKDNPYEFDFNFYSTYEITFNDDGTCVEMQEIPMDEVSFDIQKYDYIYRIIGDKVIISDNGKTVYNLVFAESPSLLYAYWLYDSESRIAFYNTSIENKNGTQRVYNGYNIIIDKKQARVTEYLKMRDAPSLSANRLKIEYQAGRSEGILPSLPPGTMVTVVGRSENLDNISGYNSYWYLVLIDFSSISEINSHAFYIIKRYDDGVQYYNSPVWVYGAFLK